MSGGGVEVAWEWPDVGAAEAAVLNSVSEPAKWVIESSGWNFERALARWCPPKKKEVKAVVQDDSPPASPTTTKKNDAGKKKKATSTKLSEAELEGDHYGLLDLDDCEWEATDDEILKAYKKKCLETHPDKTGGDDTLFKSVQVAGEVLTNPLKRKAYDSSLPFDDSIPPAKVLPENFYSAYRPVFHRNSKWYLYGKEKCPELGDDKTPMEEVDSFYSFWLAFKSWRDFSHSAAEHDLEQAEYREERRWMERENQRAVDKAKKNEMTRIITLVERAYKCDPRLKRREAEREAEKEAVREAKRQEEERKKQEEKDAADKAKRDEESRKKNKKELQAREKKARQTVRRATREYEGNPEEGGVNMQEVDWMLTKLDIDTMEAICKGLEPLAGQKERIIEYIYEQIEECELKMSESRQGKSLGPKPEVEEKKDSAAPKEEIVWSAAELLELQKACTKFPAGAMNRWERLSEYMQGKKTPIQCLKQVKVLEREYRMPQQGSSLKDVSATTKLPASEKKDAAPENYEENARKFKADEQHADPAANGNGDANGKENGKAEASDVWSSAEQKALETVLRDLKAYKDKDKWDKIAAAVGTKNKKQCVARYKFLSSSVKK
eukprot:TRINITY_DN73783_c0_g1_i1.p2 TRINITY_DN73783_c0_g1~~TRINITY_DN73783_c0_g1_i1.p2  ORF type:complete len:610 (+),score=343.76 TRINITY_DN73783_c0_g1_i1:52-1881(+)